MVFKILFLIKCLFTFLRISRCQDRAGHRIYYPGEVPDMFLALNLSNISKRANFNFSEGSCVNADGVKGKCVSVRDCPELMSYLEARGGIRTKEEIEFLRNRICSLLVNTVQLCCYPTSSSLTHTSTVSSNPKDILPTMDQCGFSKAVRITGGTEYTHGVHPWLVGVGTPRTDGSFRVICGGTLVTRKHVITAAHCLISLPRQQRLTHVILGEHSLSSNTEREAPILLRSSSTVDPGYNPISHVNDIAIMTLEREVVFTAYVSPICLPFDLQVQDFEKETFTIIGWGNTILRSKDGNDVPLMAEVSGVQKSQCREAYKNEQQIPLDKTQFCANGGTRDACQGDSGGPLLYKDSLHHHRYFLIGVISLGIGCANPDFPGIYTFVPEFLNWLKDNLKP